MSSGHTHHHHHHDGDDDFGDPRMARMLRGIVGVVAVAIVIGAIVLWPSRARTDDPLALTADPIGAHVLVVEPHACEYAPTETCNTIVFELTEGPDRGAIGTFEHGARTFVSVGDDIQVTSYSGHDGLPVYSFYEFQRTTPLLALVVVFVLAIVALGRWRGIGALCGLLASLVVIGGFALPSLVDGNAPMAVALVTAGAVAIIALYLAHGFNAATDVALLSTFASLVVVAGLGWAFIQFAKLTGYTDDATFVLDALGRGIDARGILLAGVVIGALGVLDDVTVTQVAAVRELHRAQPSRSKLELFRSAMSIGRDHISSTVNTLFLAYAGAALPLLLLFSGIGESIIGVSTREIVAVEIVRALVGSIGLVASVPISTWLAVQTLASGDRGHVDGTLPAGSAQ